MAFLTATIRDENGVSVGVLVLQSKTFASGAPGFFGQAKVEIQGIRYQVQGQLVRIKGQDAAPTEAATGATVEGEDEENAVPF